MVQTAVETGPRFFFQAPSNSYLPFFPTSESANIKSVNKISLDSFHRFATFLKKKRGERNRVLIRLSPRVRGVIRPLEISSSPVCKSLAGPLTYGGDISFHSHARNNLKSFVPLSDLVATPPRYHPRRNLKGAPLDVNQMEPRARNSS